MRDSERERERERERVRIKSLTEGDTKDLKSFLGINGEKE